MTTHAQMLANRRNAQKSTGPRTAEGKAKAAKNAIKHGLFARMDVVIPENQADFDVLREEMLAELDPAGTMESILAGRIVSLTWRLKRTERMQNELIDVKIRREINDFRPELSESLLTGKPCDLSKYSDTCYDDQVLGYVAMRDFAGSGVLERLSMYERRLEASLFRTMGELKKLQGMRKCEPVEVEQAIPPLGEAATHSEGERIKCEKQSQSRSAAGSTKFEILSSKRNAHLQSTVDEKTKSNSSPAYSSTGTRGSA